MKGGGTGLEGAGAGLGGTVVAAKRGASYLEVSRFADPAGTARSCITVRLPYPWELRGIAPKCLKMREISNA